MEIKKLTVEEILDRWKIWGVSVGVDKWTEEEWDNRNKDDQFEHDDE